MSFIHRHTKLLFSCKSVYLSVSNVKAKRLISINLKPSVSSFYSSSLSHHYSTVHSEKRLKTSVIVNYSFANLTVPSYRYLSTDSVEKTQNVVKFFSEPVSSNTTQVDGFTRTNAENLDASVSTETFNDSTAAFSTDLSTVVDNVEVPLSSLGLGSWTPVGMVQQCIELLHVQCDLPWWGSICIATCIARIFLLPLLVLAQRNAANIANYMPQLQFLQTKFNEARRTGNAYEASRYASEIMAYMKLHKINPLKNALIPLCQAPVFLSFFWGLRNMANLPVESLKTGGISWITDLTIPDPYYITPILTCATLYVVLKVGAESGMKMESMKLARYLVMAVPAIALPFTIFFPSAVLCYWCTNNFVTLGCVSLLRLNPVREFLKISKLRPVDPKFASEKKGFITSIKEAIQDQKALASVEDRMRMDEVRFKKAGTGPIPRTYAYDPTKPRPASAAAAARKIAEAKGFKS